MTNQILGWIGAGKMGGPMSRRLIEAGHSVVVLDPDAANRDRARTAGAVTVESIDQMAAEASIIFAMIPNDQVLLDLVIGKGGLAETMRDGSMLIEMSTVSPAASERVSAALKARGIDYLRAPVSGSTALAANGNLSIMISGSRQAFDAVEPLLAILSTKRFYLGDGEQARYLKLAINALVGATAPLLAEALAFGRKGGLSTDSMMNVICQSAVASPLIGYKREMIVSETYEPAFTVEQIIKDFDLIMDTARADHIPMFMAAMVRQQYENAYVEGDSQRDFFVLCKNK